MKYKKFSFDNMTLHVIKTDKFKTVDVTVQFKRKINKKEITKRRILSDILLESSKKYPTKRLLEMETEELYSLSIWNDSYISGNYHVIKIDESFLNEKYTEVNMNEKSFSFLLQLILNPNVKNDEFDDVSFDLSKKLIKDNIKTFPDNPNAYSIKRMLENLSNKNSMSYRGVGYKEDLNKITNKNLYEYYLDVLENDIVDIAVIGDVDIDMVAHYFKENFIRNNKKTILETHYNKLVCKKELNITEKTNIKQSHLVIGATVDIEDDFVRQYVLNVYSYILGGSGDSLLFNTVREKNSLCYNIYSTYNILSDVLIIKSGIDSKNKNKTVSLIKKCMEDIKNGNFDEDEIKKAKMVFKSSCLKCLDSPNSIMYNYIAHNSNIVDLLKDKYKKIDLVTKEMVMDIAKNIHIKTIYMLEGSNEERI